MKPEALAGFLPLSIDCEGQVPWMYLDVLGLVTTAIGNLIDTPDEALSLPWLRLDGSPATRREIAAEWSAIKHGGCGDYRDPLHCAWVATKGHKCLAHAGHLACEKITRLRLNADGIAAVVERARARMATQLEARFPEWQEWPWQAQLATLSVAWACGAAFRFPKLEAALRAQDFGAHVVKDGKRVPVSGAALECTIREAGNPGVAKRNVKNRALYLDATEALANTVLRPAHTSALGPAAIDDVERPSRRYG